jgi:hypothetical protein
VASALAVKAARRARLTDDTLTDIAGAINTIPQPLSAADGRVDVERSLGSLL